MINRDDEKKKKKIKIIKNIVLIIWDWSTANNFDIDVTFFVKNAKYIIEYIIIVK